jgi:hypothetical protein
LSLKHPLDWKDPPEWTKSIAYDTSSTSFPEAESLDQSLKVLDRICTSPVSISINNGGSREPKEVDDALQGCIFDTMHEVHRLRGDPTSQVGSISLTGPKYVNKSLRSSVSNAQCISFRRTR